MVLVPPAIHLLVWHNIYTYYRVFKMDWDTFQKDNVVMFFGVRNFYKKGGNQGTRSESDSSSFKCPPIHIEHPVHTNSLVQS